MRCTRFGKMLLAVATVLGLIADAGGRAEAAFTFTMEQTGSDVVVNGSGYFHPGNLPSPIASGPVGSGLDPQGAYIAVGGMADIYQVGADNPDRLGPFLGPTSFGPGGATSPSGRSGDPVFLDVAAGFFALPIAYFDFPKNLSNTMTFAGHTYASLGVTPGTYSWKVLNWQGDLIDTINLNIVKSASPIPEPTSALLLGAGLLGLAALRRRPKSDTDLTGSGGNGL